MIVVYKTKQDYSKNVYITLNHEKTKVTSFPGFTDVDTAKLPQRLLKGYFLGSGRDGETGILSVVTSLTVANYTSYIRSDSLFKLVKDNNPFVEYYECNDWSTINWLHNGQGLDTIKLNGVIVKDELNKYFERLK